MKKRDEDGNISERSNIKLKEDKQIANDKETHSNTDHAIRKMKIITFICTLFLIAELIGGTLANSLAILSDAAHLGSDLSGFVISIIALCIGKKKANKIYTYGYYRAEVIGALISVITIWILTGLLLKEAFDRLINPIEINASLMILTAIIGLICNIAMMKVLHSGHNHGKCHGHGHEHSHDKEEIKLEDLEESILEIKEKSDVISSNSLSLEENDEEAKITKHDLDSVGAIKDCNNFDNNNCKMKNENLHKKNKIHPYNCSSRNKNKHNLSHDDHDHEDHGHMHDEFQGEDLKSDTHDEHAHQHPDMHSHNHDNEGKIFLKFRKCEY
jgi:zinc transporter 2